MAKKFDEGGKGTTATDAAAQIIKAIQQKKSRLLIGSDIILNYFTSLVKQLYKAHGPVVILVDEYDKPLVDLLTNEEQFYENLGRAESFI